MKLIDWLFFRFILIGWLLFFVSIRLRVNIYAPLTYLLQIVGLDSFTAVLRNISVW